MDKYSTSCTKEQTEKAYRLGAPLKKHKGMVYTNTEKSFYGTYKGETLVKIDKSYFHIPTTEQMCAWLRLRFGLYVNSCLNCESHKPFSPVVETLNDGDLISCDPTDNYDFGIYKAIDAALDYLEKGE